MSHVSDRSQPSSTNDERNHVKPHPILTHQKAPKLRFLSSVEFRHSSGKFRATLLNKYVYSCNRSHGVLSFANREIIVALTMQH